MDKVSDTAVLVTDVPMLAPMTMGIPLCTLITPAAVIATTMEIVVEELCMMTVKRMPIIKPVIGFERNTVLEKMSPATLPATAIRATYINLMEHMKIQTQKRI